MLTTASQFGPRARSLRTNHTTVTANAHRVLGASSAAAALQQCQQTRDFRFGSWFSHLDSEVQEEVRRRQQAFKHKYADQLNRRLAWDKHPLADDARHAVKRMMASYWLSHDSRPYGRSGNDAEANKQRTPDNKDGVRPGQNIEDVERGAMEHLIFGKDEDEVARCSKPKRKRGGKKHWQTPVPHTSYGTLEQDDFVIDPVTNRKVAKYPGQTSPTGSVEIPVKTFRDYRMRFTSSYGVFNNARSAEGSPKYTYSQVEIDTNPEDTDATRDPSGKPNPKSYGDVYVQNHAHANGDSRYSEVASSGPRVSDKSSVPEYEGSHNHKPVTGDDQGSSARPDKSYNDLDKYRPVIEKETVRFEDLKPPYEDLDKYNSAVVDEIVARFESDKAPYSDLHKYDPVRDPAAPSREEAEPKYNDLEKYRTDFLDDVTPKQPENPPAYEDLNAHQSFKHNETHGKPMGHQVQSVNPELQMEPQSTVEDLQPGDFPQSTVEQLREKYGAAELRKYTAVRHLEPDGNSGLTAEELSKKYADLDKYGPVRWNEPDGNPLSSADERVAEELTKNYDPEEVAKYEPVYHNEPDGKPLPDADERVAEDLTKRYNSEELAQYTPVYWNEPDGQPVAAADPRIAEGLTKDYDPAELSEYKPVYWNEPDGQPLPSTDERVAEGLTKKYDSAELEDYKEPVEWNEPDGQPTPPADGPSKKYTELDEYGTINYQEPDVYPAGQAGSVIEGLEEMDARRDYESAERLAPKELDTADEPSAEVLRKMGKGHEFEESKESQETERRQRLEMLLRLYQTASDATDREASQAVKSAKARAAEAEPEQREASTPSERQLTGNYVRDFPEEFEKSWTETLSTAPSETVQPNDVFMYESQNMDGGLEGAFGRPSPAKIQPALDRHLGDEAHMKTSNKELRNEESHSEAVQDPESTPPAYVKQYEAAPSSAERAAETAALDTINHDSMGEPTLYKILAYDPTMQKIEVAETSSFVPDTASALTPADALLRLSHPTRFFPHFAPLKAEGYEIISGTGDVLVFRKVRPETVKPTELDAAHNEPAFATAEPGMAETRINPIDMTGKPRFSPASANFASPTGYVNYDNIPETTASKLPPPPPKIKYNIDVHREEPVFSGPKARGSDGQTGKKKSLGKRLVVGGVWVAGISYALGVIAEFFTTGGVDGMGAQGL